MINFNNPHTLTLINWVKSLSGFGAIITSTEFFHPSHTRTERRAIVQFIESRLKFKVHFPNSEDKNFVNLVPLK